MGCESTKSEVSQKKLQSWSGCNFRRVIFFFRRLLFFDFVGVVDFRIMAGVGESPDHYFAGVGVDVVLVFIHVCSEEFGAVFESGGNSPLKRGVLGVEFYSLAVGSGECAFVDKLAGSESNFHIVAFADDELVGVFLYLNFFFLPVFIKYGFALFVEFQERSIRTGGVFRGTGCALVV